MRLVSSNWGPRGFLETLRRLHRQNIELASVVDIGASNGVWTRECMRVYPAAQYFLVDALEENRGALESLRATHPNVKFWIGALGSQNGKSLLHMHGDQSSFFGSEYDRCGYEREIECRRLDELLISERVPHPTLIKADVQGYELEVLRGSPGTLRSAEFVLLELSFRRVYTGAPLAHDIIQFMAEAGYRIYDICSYAQRPRDFELFQSDILFARFDSRAFAYEGYA